MKLRKPNIFAGAFFFVLVFFLAHIQGVYAANNITITEIMFDPAGTDTNREWIEIYNGGTTAVDISHYAFLTDGVSSSHHGLTPMGSNSIPAGSYAIIVQNPDSFKIDYPAFSGLVFDSSWTGLTATSGKTLVILDDQNTVLDQVTYDPTIGAVNNGDSLQKKSNGQWVAVAPSVGKAFDDSATSSTGTGTTTGTTTSTTGSTTGGTTGTTTTSGGTGGSDPASAKKVVSIAHMNAVLSVPVTAVVGVPVSISANVTGLSSEPRPYGAYRFALGDGSMHEASNNEPFQHVYLFSGTYVVSFEYRSNTYIQNPDAVARAQIQVTALSAVTISHLYPDGSIEVANNGESDVDVSNWILEVRRGQARGRFSISSGTIILPNSAITFPSALTGFSLTGGETVDLLLPSDVVVAVYQNPDTSPSSAPIVTEALYSSAGTQAPAMYSTVKGTSENSTAVLAASVIAALPSETIPERPQKHSIIPFIIGLVGVLVAASIALFKLHIFSPKNEDNKEPETKSETQSIADEIKIIE